MGRVLGNLEKGLIFIMSAPAGAGKTTLAKRLASEFPCVSLSVSCTTRQKRENEVDGIDYCFLSKEDFENKILKNDFLEYVELFGNYYGTSRSWVEQETNQGKHVLLVIDVHGAIEIQKKLNVSSIFIMPPSFEALKERLSKRNTETSQQVDARLKQASNEMVIGRKHYDYIIVNDDLDIAYEVLRSILIAEEHCMRKQNGNKRIINQ